MKRLPGEATLESKLARGEVTVELIRAVADRVAWWAELFEVPCVGFAASLDEVEPLAAAGADFVAMDCVFTDPGGTSAAVADAARRLARTETLA